MPFTITITETTVNPAAERGREYRNTGRKADDGSDIWDYSPSDIGPKTETVTVYTQRVTNLDLEALVRWLNRQVKK